MQKPTTKFPYLCGLVLMALAIFLMIYLPDKLAQKRADSFAEPLFSHELPEGARLIQKGASENEDGTTSATIILQSTWTEEELQNFYLDTDFTGSVLEADVKAEVTLSVLPLDDSSLEAVKQAGLYEEEGGDYWFIYLYSPQKE